MYQEASYSGETQVTEGSKKQRDVNLLFLAGFCFPPKASWHEEIDGAHC